MNRVIFFLTSLIVALAFTQSASSKEDTDKKIIQVVNKTKMNIIALHISPSGQNQWGDNILVTGVFQKNEHEVITFVPTDKSICKYDIKATKVNGQDIIYKGLNLCHLLNITLYFEDGKAYAQQNIIIENETGFTILELYIREANIGNIWSQNVLGTVALNDGEQGQISFRPGGNDCFYDLLAQRFNGVDVLFENIYVCKTYKVTLFWGEGVPYVSLFYPLY